MKIPFGWSASHFAEIEYYLSDNCKVAYGQSLNFEYQTTKDKISLYDLVISYNSSKKLFVAWNAKIHRYIHKGDKIYLYGNSKIKNFDSNKNLIFNNYFFRNSANEIENAYEKVVFFTEKAIAEFCINWEEYLSPNIGDDFRYQAYYIGDNDNIGYLHADSDSYHFVRSKYKVQRLQRAADFRTRILNKYNNTCLICGCKEKKILQAAHIFGVADGGTDLTDNGICLCANHHLLFDANLISINFENNTFECFSEAEKKMEWYKKAEKQNFCLQYPIF